MNPPERKIEKSEITAVVLAGGQATRMGGEEGGMGAELVRLGPGMRTWRPCGGGGQYQVVIAGTLVHGGEELPRLSCRFATADESECEIEAGPGGLALLALQFPTLGQAGA